MPPVLWARVEVAPSTADITPATRGYRLTFDSEAAGPPYRLNRQWERHCSVGLNGAGRRGYQRPSDQRQRGRVLSPHARGVENTARFRRDLFLEKRGTRSSGLAPQSCHSRPRSRAVPSPSAAVPAEPETARFPGKSGRSSLLRGWLRIPVAVPPEALQNRGVFAFSGALARQYARQSGQLAPAVALAVLMVAPPAQAHGIGRAGLSVERLSADLAPTPTAACPPGAPIQTITVVNQAKRPAVGARGGRERGRRAVAPTPRRVGHPVRPVRPRWLAALPEGRQRCPVGSALRQSDTRLRLHGWHRDRRRLVGALLT